MLVHLKYSDLAETEIIGYRRHVLLPIPRSESDHPVRSNIGCLPLPFVLRNRRLFIISTLMMTRNGAHTRLFSGPILLRYAMMSWYSEDAKVDWSGSAGMG